MAADELLSGLTVSGWVFLYFSVTSSICAFMMYVDKLRAERGLWRISEASLLGWAFLGGALGGKLAQKLFRHKSRKQPFAAILNTWMIWNLALYTVALTPGLRDLFWAVLSNAHAGFQTI